MKTYIFEVTHRVQQGDVNAGNRGNGDMSILHSVVLNRSFFVKENTIRIATWIQNKYNEQHNIQSHYLPQQVHHASHARRPQSSNIILRYPRPNKVVLSKLGTAYSKLANALFTHSALLTQLIAHVRPIDCVEWILSVVG